MDMALLLEEPRCCHPEIILRRLKIEDLAHCISCCAHAFNSFVKWPLFQRHGLPDGALSDIIL